MLTNGRVLTEKVGDRLSECGIVELQVSVDIPVSRSPRHLRNETAEQSLLEVLSRINHIPSDVKVNLRVNAFPGFLDEFEPFADECQHRIDRDVYVYLHRVFESNVAVMNTAEAASLRYHDPSRFYRELLIAKNALRSRGFFQEYYPRGYQTGTCMAQNRRKLIFSPDGLRICVREVAGPGARVVEGIPNSVAAFYYSDSVSAKDLCWECEFLPLCQGGCVKERLERRSEYDKRCVPWKFVLRDELTEYLTREEGVAR
jgi:radical SAM protein with 4Fe4S-binding SPASM domain